MPERPKRFPPKISLKSLEKGRAEYVANCPTGNRKGKHNWGTANTFVEVDGEDMAGHVSTLECSKCYKVIHVSLTV